MTRPGAATATALLAGVLVMTAARIAVPSAPPLYDGVVVIPPYTWVDPPPGQQGGAQGATASIAVRGRRSPLIAVATPEMAPQAQVFAVPGELTMPSGTRQVRVSVEPIPAEGAPDDGHIDGNVYRIAVTDGQGTPLTAPASTHVSIALRATDPSSTDGTIARYVGGTWRPIKSSSSGFGGSLLAVVREFGDFAVIAPGPGPTRSAAAGEGEPTVSGVLPSSPVPASGLASPSATRGTDAPAPRGAPDWLAPAVVVGGVLLAAAALVARRRRRVGSPGQ